MLAKIARKSVIQGGHKHNITAFYEMLVKAARREFTEDSEETLNQFLTECHSDGFMVEQPRLRNDCSHEWVFCGASYTRRCRVCHITRLA